MAVASLIVSGIAVVVAIAAAVFAKRAADANAQLAAIEGERRADERSQAAEAAAQARRADVRVTVERGDRDPVLVVRNHGPTPATELRVEFIAAVGDGQLPHLLQPIHGVDLRPGDQQSFHLIVHLGCAWEWELRLGWVDDDGPHDERRRVMLPAG